MFLYGFGYIRQEMAREEKRAEALADRVAQMLGRRRRERALRSGCQAWRQAAVGKRRYRDALQGSALWHHRRGLTWSMTRQVVSYTEDGNDATALRGLLTRYLVWTV